MEHDHPSAANIIALYNEGAEEWDRVRKGNLIEQSWLERFRALLPSQGCVLDLGCGGGDPIAGYFLQHGYDVCGVDSSAPLIRLCQQRFPQGEWHLGDMRTLALDKTFSGVIAWDSFFHLTRSDQRKMFPVFHQHCQPGTALIFTSGPENGEALGEFIGQTLYHASLGNDEYRQLLDENGFQVVKQLTEDPQCGGRTVWLAQVR
ncbi:class I SAM-dependent methyltransferase [Scandinavium sp. V105_16]|uniref:Class I SAM-dependent methyltransferase n=1 Tax=Scandinavium lactucae TaxID=3095028 RepID=A0AAJ2SBX5_9ENTR|nr:MULTISPECIES: class I SAM-dependent methyltransferase [unclassified Scandinavium]MDX6022225.1 class I SAM-dependent methyltransferase [Scandinavium sp. V105_16]MDX6033933.1 class I SAM-dependent methyltransferase [Scandinavium sp. V105_12]MDX6042220.1 class I SAM-dependent methyltransferase [Scandinavium sp. V105_6]MDX6052221.1 class I SAM-dependent methyltransferase [Scandinavium sp. V105_1]